MRRWTAASPAGAREADVSLPMIKNERGARMELGVYPTAWRIRNEGARAGSIS